MKGDDKMFLGDMYEFEGRSKENLIEEYGKTTGLSIFLAIQTVKCLESGNWEDVSQVIYNELVNYIDE